MITLEKWEYMTIKIETKGFLGGKLDTQELDSQLNRLGEQGWELVSSFSTNKAYGESRDVVAILKRRKA